MKNLFLQIRSFFLIPLMITAGCAKLLPDTKSTAKSVALTYHISIKSGNNQTVAAGTKTSVALVAVVTDQNGNPDNGALVDWSVIGGGGNLAETNNHTDSSGNAPTALILGTTPAVNQVQATLHDTGEVVVFTVNGVIGAPSTATSTIVGTGPVEPDGINVSTVTVTLKDVAGNAVVGLTPTFTASGSGNIHGACSAGNSSGVSSCTLKSTIAETKILSLLTPISKIGGAVVFAPTAVSASTSTISATTPVIADGVAHSTVTITLKDTVGAVVGGVTPSFQATDTGSTNIYSACSASSVVTGISTCTFTSTHAESKVVSLTSPVSVTGNTVIFNPGPPNASQSTITGTGPIEADGTSTSLITITIKDAQGNPISAQTPTFQATNTGSTNTQTSCSATNASGVSTCTLKSTTPETKTLSLLTPVSVIGGTVVFSTGTVSAITSTIVGSGPVIADGVASSTVTITLKDASGVGVGGIVPVFSATNTGSQNMIGVCSTSAIYTGISTCALKSTHAETKTLSLTSPVTFSGGTVVFQPGAISSATSTITGTSSVVADGTASSAITITLLDAYLNPVSGTTPLFSATDTGSKNTYGPCSSSALTGISTCTLKSTKAEVKNLSITSPVTTVGGAVTFTHGSASLLYSSITGSTPVVPDGVTASNIVVTLQDQFGNAIDSVVPSFTATDTGSSNAYGVCASTNSSGVSTCTLTSTHAETKTLSITSPLSLTGGSVVFAAGSASSLHSSIAGTGSVTADGVATSSVTITLKDSSNLAIVGTAPTFTATDTGGGNTYHACTASNASGISTCSFSSTKAEIKTLQISSPLSLSGGTVTFTAGAPSGTTSLITGTGPVAADGSASSSISIVIYDANQNPISGVTPTFSATDSGGGNVYSACSATSATGASSCSMTSTTSGTKILSITSPVSTSGGSVIFNGGSVSSVYTTITGSGPVVADGVSTSGITITLYDSHQNPVSGIVPTFSATDTGSTNVKSACTTSNASGISTCTLKSTTAESKTLSLLTPTTVTGPAVSFTAGSPVIANSTITGTGPISADATAASTVTITLKDANSNFCVGITPTFSATDTGTTNAYGVCSVTTTAGISTCSLKSAKAETKTLSIATPVVKSGGTVVFSQAASATYSSISGTGPVIADGIATSSITITLKDASNLAIAGTVPTFTATNTNGLNTYTACSATNASGVSTCTLKSTKAESKTLSIATPIVLSGGSVVFNQSPSSTYSSITGSGPVAANGTSVSNITVTLNDASNSPIAGVVPTFTATDTGSTNIYGVCSSTNASGVSTCTLQSTKAETKTLSLVTPIVLAGGGVSFTQGVSVAYTTITGSGPVAADGVSSSTITVTLKDYNNTAVVGTTPTFSATNTNSTNSYGACSVSDASGISTCTFQSTKAETKTLSLITPIAVTGGNVVFSQTASSTYSTIVGTGSVAADGAASSAVTITLNDYANTPIVGITPTFSATDTSSLNVYGACSLTNSSGVSTCSLKSTKGETKTLSISTPLVSSGGSVIFTQVPLAANSSITGTGPVTSNGTSASTITITIRDYANTGVAGIVPTFSATNTGTTNVYGPCSSTNASGVSTCTLKSTHAQTKTLSIASPVILTGGNVVFN